jgi:hypothetical protein
VIKEIAAVKCVIDFRIMFLNLKGDHCKVKKYTQAAHTLVKKLSSSQV